MKKTAVSLAALLTVLSLLLAGCAPQTVDPSKIDYEKLATNNLQDWTVSANTVFDVNWFLDDDDFFAGSAFCMKTEFSEEPVILTAFHIFGLDSGEELDETFLGADVYDTFDPESVDPITEVYGEVLLKDAAPLPDVAHDAAAFHAYDYSRMTVLSPAAKECKPGDVIYLVAYLDSQYYYEDGVYPAVVISVDDDTIEYAIDPDFTTSGVSGAPLLNKDGDVVGIHLGTEQTDSSLRVGHTIGSILKMLKPALS